MNFDAKKERRKNLVNCVLVIFFLQPDQLLVRRNIFKVPYVHKKKLSLKWRQNLTACEFYNPLAPAKRAQRSHGEDLFFPPHRRENNDPSLRPYFDDNVQTNVSFQLPKTAYIHCSIHNVIDKVVSFVRQRDKHILTVGQYTYTTDQRFAAYHLNDSVDWTLEIRDTRRSDTGIYECQEPREYLDNKYGFSVEKNWSDVPGKGSSGQYHFAFNSHDTVAILTD
ncbi:uncharacterized protein CDAR_68931 [Caerostris darwini]|uniref:Ig-like domain-containing protein n=1 Tax=Caerostris darwini TaxID=1538125 RepID=A0AAV4SZS6_9ARAC|nr:uncharacterized protein CDAR_68931 [Caerostris darwini]